MISFLRTLTALFGGSDASEEDGDQLIRLLNEGLQFCRWLDHSCPFNDFESNLGFAKLLERDFQFVNEIRSGFRTCRFAIIGSW